MLNYNEIQKLAEIIKNNFLKDALELADTLEFVNMALDDIYDKIQNKITLSLTNRDTKTSYEFLPLCDTVLELKKFILGYKDLLVDESAEEKKIAEENIDEEKEKIYMPNYASYIVDDTIPHNLKDDFTYTKACGFEFKGKKYETRDMRDVLVKVCSILAQEDITKMQSFIDDPTMKGTKVSYFGKEPVIEINPKNNQEVYKNRRIPKTNIYVWVHFSSNDLAKMIMRVFKKYNIDTREIKIFLKADYKELHKAEQKNCDNTPHKGEERIGKHVATCMRKLSNENYQFSHNDLIAMQSLKWCKDILGIYSPLIKKYDDKIDKNSQVLINGYPRYWKEIYIFNGEEYFVTSQWYEKHRQKFDEWFRSLNV